ncbi:MAG: AAA family ATPase, partial [Verrucomicrobia bacterium]|nr:AAA family ATPase [Verrucomicrobiota bacterium]
DAGVTLSREEWLRKLDSNDGDVNKFMRTSDRNGIFVSVNPLRIGGSKDADVTSYRHCLLEFDAISQEEQWSLIKQSGIPATAVISSGGKSIHAWVNVDAKDRSEFNERVKLVYEHFAEWKPDAKNKNPSRFSRLPGCVRGKRRQELLAVQIGAPSFSEWHAGLTTESVGQITSIADLLAFDPSTDQNTVLGKRWLCRGSSCLVVGQSGLGKSSFAIQAAVTWALGRPLFGITPVKPLKSLFIQAENDFGDLAEMVQGVVTGLGCTPAELKLINENVIIVREAVHTGFEFARAVQRLIDRYKPDLVWFDPLLSFIGDDISKQSVCSQFLRSWLGPIGEATGVIWMMIHHTGKPATDPKSKSKWLSTDFSYSGIGSSELTNWARAICNLERFDETHFKLMLSKRGKRADARDVFGNPTCQIWLIHSETGIRWEQVTEPVKAKTHTIAPSEKSEISSPLDKFMPHWEAWRDSWTDTELHDMGDAVNKLEEFCKLEKFKLKEGEASAILKMSGDRGLMILKITQEGYRCSMIF